MVPEKAAQISFMAGQVFTPGSPINERELFAGRVDQISKILSAVSQRGYHAALYGERGVGKTSLSNVLIGFLGDVATGVNYLMPRVNCDATDDFDSVWRKLFANITYSQLKPAVGFTGQTSLEPASFASALAEKLTPHEVRVAIERLVSNFNVIPVFVFDEFDRANNEVAIQMADLIKALSDYAVKATILLIGVADSVDELVRGHRSIERALMQIAMPRMSAPEIREIIKNGSQRLDIPVENGAMTEIVTLSQGIPYITHLLALQSVRAACASQADTITAQHVERAIEKALDQWQQSTKSAYYEATRSQQPQHIYKEVLLACALAETDDLGWFTAASVRAPLRVVTSKPYEIPNFARHLKELSETSRGEMLQRTGEKRRIRYRFGSPIMRPYIIMRGFADQILNKKMMQKLGS